MKAEVAKLGGEFIASGNIYCIADFYPSKTDIFSILPKKAVTA